MRRVVGLFILLGLACAPDGTGTNGPVELGTSQSGLTVTNNWTPFRGPPGGPNSTIIDTGSFDYSPSAMFDPADGLYKLWWCSVYGISYAQSTNLDGNWQITNGVFRGSKWAGGSPGDFDYLDVCDPSVLKIDGVYYMYYGSANYLPNCPAGTNQGCYTPNYQTTQRKGGIGLATSADGIHWTRANPGSQPILVARGYNADGTIQSAWIQTTAVLSTCNPATSAGCCAQGGWGYNWANGTNPYGTTAPGWCEYDGYGAGQPSVWQDGAGGFQMAFTDTTASWINPPYGQSNTYYVVAADPQFRTNAMAFDPVAKNWRPYSPPQWSSQGVYNPVLAGINAPDLAFSYDLGKLIFTRVSYNGGNRIVFDFWNWTAGSQGSVLAAAKGNPCNGTTNGGPCTDPAITSVEELALVRDPLGHALPPRPGTNQIPFDVIYTVGSYSNIGAWNLSHAGWDLLATP